MLDLLRRTALAAVLALFSLSILSCDQAMPTEPPPEGTPRLVLLVVSDQFRYDYLERLRPLFRGGLKRLLDDGASFVETHHGHAVTSTGPGHASLVSGVHPARSGIVGNYWYDRNRAEEVYVVEDPNVEVSPANLEVGTLGDWMRERYPEARVFGVSGKDRGAVLSVGHRADGAYWFDEEQGGMVTSGYYTEATPGWLDTLNHAGPPGDLLLDAWRPLPVSPVAAEAAGFWPFDRGPFRSGFPHLIGGDSLRLDEDFLDGVYRTPFLDQWVGAIGLGLVKAHDLGGDEWPDLLALSFSAVDTVGHQYGPHSLEVLDTLLRLDRVLGTLFHHLDETVGAGRWVVAFSADHGVVPVPEVLGQPERRAGLEEIRCLRRVVSRFEELYGDDIWLGEPVFLEHRALEAAGVSPRAAQVELAEQVSLCPNVRRVWTLTEILGGDGEPGSREESSSDPSPTTSRDAAEPGSPDWFRTLYRNGAHPERSPDIHIQWEEGFLPALGSRTAHGSPYEYDTHVPFLLAGPGIEAGQYGGVAWTVDVAPTLAALLGVKTPTEIDGVNLLPRLAAAREGAD